MSFNAANELARFAETAVKTDVLEEGVQLEFTQEGIISSAQPKMEHWNGRILDRAEKGGQTVFPGRPARLQGSLKGPATLVTYMPPRISSVFVVSGFQAAAPPAIIAAFAAMAFAKMHSHSSEPLVAAQICMLLLMSGGAVGLLATLKNDVCAADSSSVGDSFVELRTSPVSGGQPA